MSPESPTQNHTKNVTAKEKKRSLTYRFFNQVFFSILFFSNIQTQDDIIQISPALRPPPTLITFGVVTLAIALVGLITLTLAAAVTLATLTRPRGLVSGRSIRRPPIRGHNIIEIYGLSVPPMPPLSLGETIAILMEKPTQTPRGVYLPAVPVWTNWIYQSQDPCWKLPSNPSLASRCWAHPGVISDKRHRGFCC